MGEVVSKAADTILPLAKDVLTLVEDPVTALLPETEGIFKAVSSMLGSASTPSSKPAVAEQHQAQRLVGELPALKGTEKQSTMVRIVELLLDELEAQA
jgi:hypothetical protein